MRTFADLFAQAKSEIDLSRVSYSMRDVQRRVDELRRNEVDLVLAAALDRLAAALERIEAA